MLVIRGEKSGDLLVGYITVYILVLYAKKIFLFFTRTTSMN